MNTRAQKLQKAYQAYKEKVKEAENNVYILYQGDDYCTPDFIIGVFTDYYKLLDAKVKADKVYEDDSHTRTYIETYILNKAEQSWEVYEE